MLISALPDLQKGEPTLKASCEPARDNACKVPGHLSESSDISTPLPPTKGFKAGVALLVDGAFLSATF